MMISRLRVGDENFLVSSIIERCPKTMMLRELVKNALEAAANAPPGERRVAIAPVTIEGTRKLSIWNTGPGMDADELYRMCDIASSIGKENALHENFGMGAKVASLPSNHHGICYISCKAGRVHQVLMGKRDQAYGRLQQVRPDGGPADVIEVSDQVAAEGLCLDTDWTQVVLFGQRPDQDTVGDPYDGNPHMPPGWIAEDLYARFFSLPKGISLTLDEGCHIATGSRDFVPMHARAGDFDRYEAVPVERGITLHYFFDAPDPDHPGRNRSARGALAAPPGSAGLIYRREIYDLRPLGAWMHEAPIYGIPFGGRNITVFVELPDDFPLLPDGYRQFLRHAHNLQHHLQTREFAPLVLRHRPTWLIEMLHSFAPDARHTAALHGEMATLFKRLAVRRRWWPPGDGGRPSPRPDESDGGTEYEVAPAIIPLRDAVDAHERGMAGTAARFYPETHQLFINAGYPGFDAFRGILEAEFAAAEDQETMRMTALTVSEHVLIRQICRKLVFALSKRDVWKPWEVDQATSMYSLTLAVDDSVALLDEARAEMRKQIGATTLDPKLERARSRFASAMEELLSLTSHQPGGHPVELVMRLA